MKLTLSWLKDHLETDASLAEIVERLTSIGLEVEHVDDKAALKPFVIARVLTAEKHPEADRLRVLSVDTGDGKPIQVVCGAPNARAGLVGAFAARVKLNIGLLCSEVFTFQGLMVEKIEGEMGIPLSEIRQFNVKGKVQIYKKSGELVELGLRKAQEYARPECHHCGDFSGELADISCGGVGTHNWTIVVVRTRRGEEVIEAMVRDGLLELRSMDEFESSMKVLIRLARRQRARVPVPPGRDESFVRLPEEKRA